MKFKSIIVGSCCLFLAGCSSAREFSSVTPKNEPTQVNHSMTLQSEVLKTEYVIRDVYDNDLCTVELASTGWTPKEIIDRSDIVVAGTVTEVESYAKGVNIFSEIILDVEKVLKNESEFDVNETIRFTALQGMVPLYEVQDALPEVISQNFNRSQYTEEEMNEYVVEIESGDILYEIGMEGVFPLVFRERTQDFRQTVSKNSAYIKIDDENYMPSSAYKIFFEPALSFTYSDRFEDIGDEPWIPDIEEYLMPVERVREITGLPVD